MTNKQVIEKYLLGGRTGANFKRTIYIIGDDLYSYGQHYVLARRAEDGTFIFNNRRYSITTARHKIILRASATKLNFGYLVAEL